MAGDFSAAEEDEDPVGRLRTRRRRGSSRAMARAFDERVQQHEQAGAEPSSRENERPPPSMHQTPDSHNVGIRGCGKGMRERCGKGGWPVRSIIRKKESHSFSREDRFSALDNDLVFRTGRGRDKGFYIVVDAPVGVSAGTLQSSSRRR